MNTIDRLLEKYWEGETTLVDEAELHDYFSGGDIAPSHKAYQPLFEYQISERERQLDFDPFAKLEESDPKVIPLKSSGIRQLRKWSVAASIAVICMLGIGYLSQPAEPNLGTYEDPQLAYNEAKQTLLMVSQKFQSGKKQVQPIQQLHTRTDKIFKLNK